MMQLQNNFTQFELTPDELKSGQLLSPYQEAVLQNRLATPAFLKNALRVDPTDISKFIQEEAYLTGQIELLQEILFESNNIRTKENTQ